MWSLARRLARGEGGAAAIQIALTSAAFFGFAGLAIDLGRTFTLNSELQHAADAAALAAAAELDGFSGARDRATAAATAFVANSQTFASDGLGAGIQIASIRFLSRIQASTTLLPPVPAPAGDAEARNDVEAVYVRVVTQARSVSGTLAQFVAANSVFSTTAVATAGRLPIVCLDVPLMICNPTESAGEEITLRRGQQILVKDHRASVTGLNPSGSWAPGVYGLLDPPGPSQGASATGRFLAEASHEATACGLAIASIRPGQANSVNKGLNTRFDIYSSPFNRNDRDHPPAANVTKGYNVPVGARTACEAVPAAAPSAMALPRDSCFATDSCALVRTGDGDWDRNAYWQVNHAPAPYTAPIPSGLAAATRYEMYLWEIENGLPDANAATGSTRESGAPACYSGSGTPSADRRLLNVAIVNCQAAALHGNDSVRPVAYFQGFLTEPVGTTNEQDIYIEVVRTYEFGDPTSPLHNNTVLVR